MVCVTLGLPRFQPNWTHLHHSQCSMESRGINHCYMQLRYACKWCSLQSKIMHTTTLHKECSEKCQSRVWTPMLSFLVSAQHPSPRDLPSPKWSCILSLAWNLKAKEDPNFKFTSSKGLGCCHYCRCMLHKLQLAQCSHGSRWGFLRAPFAIFRLGLVGLRHLLYVFTHTGNKSRRLHLSHYE